MPPPQQPEPSITTTVVPPPQPQANIPDTEQAIVCISIQNKYICYLFLLVVVGTSIAVKQIFKLLYTCKQLERERRLQAIAQRQQNMAMDITDEVLGDNEDVIANAEEEIEGVVVTDVDMPDQDEAEERERRLSAIANRQSIAGMLFALEKGNTCFFLHTFV